jgi:asparagine N-glycosylation enzyme membrane subunit Stt3
MIIGVLMMALSAVAMFLMALRWIHSTFLLNFVAVMSSVVGSTLGFYGLFTKTHPKAR